MVKSTAVYRALSLVSTLLLMGGVICLANARIETQTGFAGSYMLINIFYWIGAALPPANHWDLSRLHLEHCELRGGSPPATALKDKDSPTYTVALWKAIAVTGTSAWVKEAGFAPSTQAWKGWLEEAEEAAMGEPVIKAREKDERGHVKEVWKIRNWNSRHALSTHLSRTNTSRFQTA